MDHIGGRRPGVTARLHCVDRIGRDKSRETARSSGLRRPRPQGDLVAQHGTLSCLSSLLSPKAHRLFLVRCGTNRSRASKNSTLPRRLDP